jgi:hypothetical protein
LRKTASKIANGCAQNTKNSFGLDFLERYNKSGDEFFNHVVRVTSDEAWGLFVNVETKEQSKQWMHTHSPSKLKKCKQILYARELMAVVFWEGKEC